MTSSHREEYTLAQIIVAEYISFGLMAVTCSVLNNKYSLITKFQLYITFIVYIAIPILKFSSLFTIYNLQYTMLHAKLCIPPW